MQAQLAYNDMQIACKSPGFEYNIQASRLVEGRGVEADQVGEAPLVEYSDDEDALRKLAGNSELPCSA